MLDDGSMQLGEASTVVASDRQIACQVGGEAVILQLDDAIYYGLNQVGARIWQLLQEPRRVSEIVDVIVAEYEVERERCLQDVLELVAELRDRRLVTVRDDAAVAPP